MTLCTSRTKRGTSIRWGAMTCAMVSLLLSACAGSSKETRKITLIAYDSFTVPDNAFDTFTARTGIQVELALGGDAGELASKAVLTAGDPEGDVLWGIDNALLTRVVDADVFEPYVSRPSSSNPGILDSGLGVATPVDIGYVCINYDKDEFARRQLTPPKTLDDLTQPEYRGLLVTQNPTTSSPGLAFLLATVAKFGDEWPAYWRGLLTNDVLVVDNWTDAYYSSFSRHGGDRPLVVSYSTSPPAEVILADPPLAEGTPAPTGVVTDTCFQQIEYAGILRGTTRPEDAKLLIDFLVDREFQSLLAENLFVYSIRSDVQTPDSFENYAIPVVSPLVMQSDEIGRRRVELLETWARLGNS